MIDERFDGLVCDLDGVVYRGDEPIDGAAEAIAALRERGTRIVFCTNNSRSTVSQYVDKLARVGVDATPDDVLTSAVVTARRLQQDGASGRSAFVVGGDGIREELTRVGIRIVVSPEVDLVVVGWDPDFTYDAMRTAALAVRAGARFIATNDDAAFPAAGGQLWPGAGALLASIETASGRRAEVMGKPHRPMMEAAAERLSGCRRIAVVGDRPETDLRGGAVMGWKRILVTTGVVGREEAAGDVDEADLVIDSLGELL